MQIWKLSGEEGLTSNEDSLHCHLMKLIKSCHCCSEYKGVKCKSNDSISFCDDNKSFRVNRTGTAYVSLPPPFVLYFYFSICFCIEHTDTTIYILRSDAVRNVHSLIRDLHHKRSCISFATFVI